MSEKEKEQQHVEIVTHHISETLAILSGEIHQNIQKGKVAVKEGATVKIKDGNEEALRESAFEIKEHEDELIMLHQIDKRKKRQVLQLEKMESNPYFGRIDIETNEGIETYYLGLSSFIYQNKDEVLDWRTPIASLFYEDGLGKKEYVIEENEPEKVVNLIKKRQFIIKNRLIEVMEDTDQTIADEVLLKTLSLPSSHKMKQITATIQSEQNQIIRDTHHQNILIQGVAGSGKTAVLLQRLAYLLYSKRSQLESSQVLMFSPNAVFSEYISNVLPSLGEEDIYRTSFEYFMTQFLKGVQIIEETQYAQKVTSFLYSYRGYQVVQEYLTHLLKGGLQFTSLRRFDGQLLLSKKDLIQIYQQQPGKSVGQKVSFLKKVVQEFIARQKQQFEESEEILDQIDLYGQQILDDNEQLFSQMSEKEIENCLRKEIVNQMYQEVERTIETLSFIRDDLQYLHFLLFLHQKDASFKWDDYFKQVKQNMKENKAYPIDRLMIVLFKQCIKGNQDIHSFKEIMIDEIQDYTPIQLLLIKALYPNAHYTFCGDSNQLIFKNEHLLDEMESLFNHQLKRYYLSKSYRSTAEIVKFADEILGNKSQAIVPRHGNKPVIWTHSLIALLEKINTDSQRIAIITPTMRDARQLSQKHHEWTLIDNHSKLKDTGVMILPIDLAKGLEFDTVIIVGLSDAVTDKVFYTMATRAMHQLYILDNKAFVSEYYNISRDSYCVD